MGKLFLVDDPNVLRDSRNVTSDDVVIRNRKKNPLHPESIEDRLREKAVQNSLRLAVPTQKWLLILWINEHEKRYSDLEGTYKDVVRYRDNIMECGDYEAATLVLKTNGFRG